MKQLLAINESDFNPKSPSLSTENFKTREAARAVLLSEKNEVYLIDVTLHGYHKLPGGGVDKGEDIKAALVRELMEEVGCRAEIVSELGTVIEYRNYERLKQTSYCFLARQAGDQLESALEADELANGMVGIKVKNLEEAIRLLEHDKPDDLGGEFIRRRDLCFLKAAQLSM